MTFEILMIFVFVAHVFFFTVPMTFEFLMFLYPAHVFFWLGLLMTFEFFMLSFVAHEFLFFKENFSVTHDFLADHDFFL